MISSNSLSLSHPTMITVNNKFMQILITNPSLFSNFGRFKKITTLFFRFFSSGFSKKKIEPNLIRISSVLKTQLLINMMQCHLHHIQTVNNKFMQLVEWWESRWLYPNGNV